MQTPTRSILVALALVALASAVVVATATATAPGKNGSIAYRRYFDRDQTRGAVFTIAADGKSIRQVTHPPKGVDDQPDWAPDGKLITFTRCPVDGGTCHVWVVAPDGTGVAPVGALCAASSDPTVCPDDSNPSFSPDSKQIAFVQANGRIKADTALNSDIIEHSALTVMNVDGSDRRVVYQPPSFSSDISYPMQSPNGKQFLFERVNSGFSKPAGKRAVFVIGADGTGLKQLTSWTENSGDNPDWSPDGKWILFHTHVDGPNGQYFLIHPDGTGKRQITHFGKDVNVRSGSFSPDGRQIVMSEGPTDGNAHVYTMRLDGSHIQRVTRSTLWDSAPDWGPR
jgi:Tol biopolymer transport system component